MIKNMSYSQQRKLIIIIFLLLPVTFLITFTFLPAINMFYYSFTEWNGYSPIKKWIGLRNYIELFKNPQYFVVFKNSLYYFFGGLIQIALAFYFALIVNGKIKGKNFIKAIFFFPFLINSVAISLIFVFFFRPEGTLDTILNLIGLQKYINYG